MENESVVKRQDGKYEEILGEVWSAEYYEDPETGLWQVEIFKHGAAEWHNINYESLEAAREAAHNFYNQA